MADRKPLKVLPDSASGTGGGDSTGIGEFVEADTLGVVDGGTGLGTVATDNILTGNGTSALSAESNLTFDGSTLTVSGALSATGNVSFDGGSFVFNESGADKDFRIEGDTQANLFVADASTDRIGIGTATPTDPLTLSYAAADYATGLVIHNTNTAGYGATIRFETEYGGGTDKHAALSATASGSGGALDFYTGSDATTLNRVMRIDPAGNIMAGGTTSTYNASFGAANDVFVDIGGAGGGAVEFTRGADANATWIGGIHFANTNNSSTSNNANGYGIASILGEVVTTDSNAHDDSGGSIVFYTKTEAAASAERMRVDSAGNVIIGGSTTTTNWTAEGKLFIEAAIPGIGLRDTTGSADDWMIVNSNGTLTIANDTDNTQPVVVTDGGDVGIGTTSPSNNRLAVVNSTSQNVVRIDNTNSSPYGLQINFSTDTDNNSNHFFIANGAGTAKTRIYADGDVWTSDAGTLTSDERLKTNIVDASDKLADVMRLKIRNFEWTAEYHPNKVGEKKIGFIAQELETVFPSLVTDHDIAADNSIDAQLYTAEDDTQYYVDSDELPEGKQVGDVKTESQIPDGNEIGDIKVAAKAHEPTMRKSYKNAFTPILVKALQEVTVRLEAAESKIATLESA